MTVVLSSAVRTVSIQFSFTNLSAVPNYVKLLTNRRQEIVQRSTLRQERGSGKRIIEPTQKVSVEALIPSLETAGYQLVDAMYEERRDFEREGRPFQMVRFTFEQKDLAQPSNTATQMKERLRESAIDMCTTAFWRVRVFLNPFYQNDEELSGVHVVSINLEARVSRFLPNGNPIREWQKNEAGQRIGAGPVPIMAEQKLELVDGELQLIP